MERMTYTEWFNKTVDAYNRGDHDERIGQFFFNRLYDLKPDLADSIRGTADDPFYNDGLFAEFCGVVAYAFSKHDVIPDGT